MAAAKLSITVACLGSKSTNLSMDRWVVAAVNKTVTNEELIASLIRR